MRIAVIGGRGVLGREVVRAARDGGHEAVAVSRAGGVDVITGAGLDDALTGVDVVVDVSTTTGQSAKASIEFFTTATRNLLAAEQRAGVDHHVAVSIVGIDRVDYGYYRGKVAQESLLLDSTAASRSTVLRATQFHEFAAQMLDRIRGPIVPALRAVCQPVSARETGEALFRLAVGPPSGRVPDLAGPERLRLPDMMRSVLRARGQRRVLIPVALPGAAGRAMRTDGLVPATDGPRGTETFSQWLERTGGRVT